MSTIVWSISMLVIGAIFSWYFTHKYYKRSEKDLLVALDRLQVIGENMNTQFKLLEKLPIPINDFKLKQDVNGSWQVLWEQFVDLKCEIAARRQEPNPEK